MASELLQPLVPVADDAEAVNDLYLARRWGDGLPVIPPTPERVRRMLRFTDYRPDDCIATVAPAFGAATVERIAINAVLAGCHPSYLPVLVAAVRAVAEPAFNLQAIQATTNPVAVFMLLNGPVAQQLEVNGGYNCLGQGRRANATLGRALRLILQNVGGALPGEMDRATHGQPGKYTFCCAENETATPSEPLHVERGFPVATSTVTVIGASGTLNMIEHTGDADDLLRVMADTLAFPMSNEYLFGGEPAILLGPEHAEILARAGLSKAAVKRRLWEGSRLPGRRFSHAFLYRMIAHRRTDVPRPIGEDTLIPIAPRAEDMTIVVAGGPSIHSVYLPTFGDTRAVTHAIADARGAPIARFGIAYR
ncbi:MAG: hypothetical protein HYU88_07285 [Chloroflexi bacterium]|nr:hypothetical protein [Chloroflexota bacterium]